MSDILIGLIIIPQAVMVLAQVICLMEVFDDSESIFKNLFLMPFSLQIIAYESLDSKLSKVGTIIGISFVSLFCIASNIILAAIAIFMSSCIIVWKGFARLFRKKEVE